jgi:hypothetical protein
VDIRIPILDRTRIGNTHILDHTRIDNTRIIDHTRIREDGGMS